TSAFISRYCSVGRGALHKGLTKPPLEDNDPTQAKQLRVNRLRNLVGQLKDLCPLQKSTMLAALQVFELVDEAGNSSYNKIYIPHNNLVLSALMVVSIKELDIEAVDCGRTVDVWHQEKLRTTFVFLI
ncbi:hypothetical protein DPMN_085831, partial [Dreissena polymorpha]